MPDHECVRYAPPSPAQDGVILARRLSRAPCHARAAGMDEALAELDKAVDGSQNSARAYPGGNGPPTTHHETGNRVENLPRATIAPGHGTCGRAVGLSLGFGFARPRSRGR